MYTVLNDRGTLVVESHSSMETMEFGKTLGRQLSPGCVVALEGPLGAGKTHLTKGMALGLGVPDERTVISPTFVLMNSYTGRHPMKHVDCYRLDREEDLIGLGWYDFLKTDVLVCEWADRVRSHLGPDHLYVTMQILSEEGRRIAVTAVGERSREILNNLAQITFI